MTVHVAPHIAVEPSDSLRESHASSRRTSSRQSAAHASAVANHITSYVERTFSAGSSALSLIIVTDVGPDPDDAKALLITATLHCQRLVTLRAVIANGGHQATERARLARCLLDHVGAHHVPVGVGSAGHVYTPQPHEYALDGYERTSERALLDGRELFVDVLRRAAPRSLRVVLISSLRDFADVIAAHPELVLAKVHTVAIQGGLQPSDSGVAGWEPDSSVNNTFDMAAARTVYSFCFSSGLPMTVTSRNAVPMLPMQLARSFADRTHCPVMRYLAEAQYFGLEGLWRKLCAGKLPARCTKQWFFETFCGVAPADFEARGLDALGADVPISAHLNGFVKPYDVVSLMTVIPQTAALFAADARFEFNQTSHMLLLEPKHTVDVSRMLNLLRETYHEVVLATSKKRRSAAVAQGNEIRRAPRRSDQVRMALRSSLRFVANFDLGAFATNTRRRTRASGVGARAAVDAADGAARDGDSEPGSARGAPSGSLDGGSETSDANAGDGGGGGGGGGGDGLHAAALTSDEIVDVLSRAVEAARHTQHAVTRGALALGVSLLLLAALAKLVDAAVLPRARGGAADAGAAGGWAQLSARAQRETVRDTSYLLVGVVGVPFVLAPLSPLQRDAPWIRIAAMLLGLALIASQLATLPQIAAEYAGLGATPYEDEHAALHPSAAESYRACKVVELACVVLGFWLLPLLLVLRALCSRFRRYDRPAALLAAVWRVAGAALALAALVQLIGVAKARASSAMDLWRPWYAPVASAQAALLLLIGISMATDSIRVRVSALLAHAFAARGTVASLAPLIGYGSLAGEAEARELCDEATRAFNPCTLDAELRRALLQGGLLAMHALAPIPGLKRARTRPTMRAAGAAGADGDGAHEDGGDAGAGVDGLRARAAVAAAAAAAAIAAKDADDISADAYVSAVSDRIVLAVELATVTNFNAKVRDLLPAVHRAGVLFSARERERTSLRAESRASPRPGDSGLPELPSSARQLIRASAEGASASCADRSRARAATSRGDWTNGVAGGLGRARGRATTEALERLSAAAPSAPCLAASAPAAELL
ncbi:hypothetical protein KFE25_004819 [Diacronema lutheri]|uniref:Inosine/uridine-preferring nucleoside hydrolase domain-containing protein n=1 Tax=Diacronema lutheri TaxID=2081491 RepID=A0A8J5XB58_DIALT|nr:hypothetical protein KFE25_004819 [Diacronema lutheri]